MSSEESYRHLFKDNTLVIVTGASRGLGKAIVQGFADRFVELNANGGQQRPMKLSFIIMARDKNLLNDLKQDIERKSSAITVIGVIAGDLKDEKTSQLFEESIKNIETVFDEAMLVHNAATLGDPSKLVKDYSAADSEFLTSYFETNVLSVIKMTAAFLNAFGALSKHCTIVNISSKAAVAAMKGMSVYSTGKAAREAYFRNVAIETENTSVLNYSPGPLITDMTVPMTENSFMKDFFLNKDNLLQPEQSVEKLVKLLEGGDYVNGAHIDVFDVN